MAALCVSPDADLGLIQSLLGSVDCNVQNFAEAGYGALSRPGSSVAAALTILLTLYVAVIGLRLMVGHAPLRIGELTMSVLKIGVILALATNWPTYQQIVFDTLVKGPEQLGQIFLRGAQAPGSAAGDPLGGLQFAYDQMQSGASYFNLRSTPSMSPLQGGPGFAAFALNVSALLLILTTLGSLLAAKIVLALLLGLGPIFIAFLLFDVTRGLFEGWLRAAIGFALVPLLSILGLVVQLSLLAPQLDRMVELIGQKSLDLGPASAIFLLSLIFAMVNAALLLAVSVMAASLRLPSRRNEVATRVETNQTALAAAGAAAASGPQAAVYQPPGRAARIATAAAALERRDHLAAATPGADRLVIAPRFADARQPVLRERMAAQTYRRSAQPRRAASSLRRDQ